MITKYKAQPKSLKKVIERLKFRRNKILINLTK